MIDGNAKSRCSGCGGEKQAGYITCKTCWYKLPLELRDQWGLARGKIAKRIVARRILEHVRLEREAK